MKNVKMAICLMLAVLFMATGQGFGWTQFKDGGTHNINYTINDDVWVDYLSPGIQTVVNVLTGGSIPSPYILQTFQDSRTNIFDGTLGNYFYAYNNSQVAISGGSLSGLCTFDSSYATISGGSVGALHARDSGQVIISGGSIRDLYAYNSNHITMSNGSVSGYLEARDNSQVIIYDGSLYRLFTYGNGQITILSGSVSGSFQARGNGQGIISGGSMDGLSALDTSHVIISGGSVLGGMEAFGSSQITMSGGSVGGGLRIISNGHVTMSGGSIAAALRLEQQAILTIEGSNFAIDGIPFDFGEITSILGLSYFNDPSRTLTGTLANGDSINNQFRIGETAKIVLIPESTTPPIADAGSDQTVTDVDDNGSELVTLDGSGSTDSDGTIQSYVWREGSIQIATGVNPMVTLPVGTHIITLTVTDNDGLTDANAVNVTIETFSNQPPVADADGPYTIYVGDTLTLDASGSTDNDNDIVSYLWDLDDNNSFETDAGSNAVFDVNYAYLQSLGLLVGNTYKIHLKVTDGGGLSNVANSTLTIIPKPALQVIVDIKPGSCPNPLNVKSSGVLPVAILGTADFDVTTIDATSIRLAGVSPLRSSIEDVGRPAIDSNDCNCTEDGPDGFADLTLKFKTQDIVEAIGDVNYGNTVTLRLTGVVIGERPIEGADCVVIGGKSKPFNKADVNKDGVVDSLDFAEFAQNWLQSSIVED